MAKKVYRVIARIGRKRNVIWESDAFDPTDGCVDYYNYKQALKARENHCMGLWRDGYSVTIDGRYHHIGKNLDGGHIEIVLCSK